MILRLLPAFAILALASCAAPVAVVETSVFSSVTRSQCMNLAEAYKTHRWTPTAYNIRHGNDARGIRVDTPDATYKGAGVIPGHWRDGEASEGVPYQWGGFCTIAEFDAGIRAGKGAGDVYTSEKRRLLDAAVSDDCVGIDCSGFISRCWRLPRSYSTRELAGLCEPLASWSELKPGDILNTYNAHCLLFAGWHDAEQKRLIAYETGSPPHWKVVSHIIDAKWLRGLGYRPLRYTRMRDG